MSKVDLSQEVNGHIVLHVTQSIVMYRQHGFWFEAERRYQFVPCRSFGFVVATRPETPIGGDVLIAWKVYRPRALSLSWSYEKKVDFRELEHGDAVTWCDSYRKPWKHIRPKRVTT